MEEPGGHARRQRGSVKKCNTGLQLALLFLRFVNLIMLNHLRAAGAEGLQMSLFTGTLRKPKTVDSPYFLPSVSSGELTFMQKFHAKQTWQDCLRLPPPRVPFLLPPLYASFAFI